MQPSNYHVPAAEQELLKTYLLKNSIEEFSGKQWGEWVSRQKKKEDKTERAMEVDKKTTRDQIVKWNQMTVLRFQTGGGWMGSVGWGGEERHQTFPASIQGPHYRSHSWYLTPGQPRRSIRDERQVINSQTKLRLTVYVTRPLMVEEDWEKVKSTERRR